MSVKKKPIKKTEHARKTKRSSERQDGNETRRAFEKLVLLYRHVREEKRVDIEYTTFKEVQRLNSRFYFICGIMTRTWRGWKRAKVGVGMSERRRGVRGRQETQLKE
ncbi:hypothetical protein NPIL_217081 [Nephila pilipes]|uniref:Uncharacterized protein n=1 Tax=Nephila pilipes TaxID=299642 RepID=A0A8X6PWE2_NEPPI|nr:hypothetical protein NPIL_217081 [Nephila pilipes]